MNHISKIHSNPILIAALLANPITLLLLTGSWFWSLFIPFVAICITILTFSFNNKFRLKVWWFNILAIFAICYNGELIFRTFYSQKDIPLLYEAHDGYYFNLPNLSETFVNEEFQSSYHTNCEGYRMPASGNAQKRISECDWLFIGDSFTQGAQVEYEDLFTSQLNRAYPDKIIVNAGISGAGIYELASYLEDEGIKLKPKRVFLQLGVFNDFFDVKPHSLTFCDWLSEKSHLFRYLYYNFTELIDQKKLNRWAEPFRPSEQENIDFNILFKETSPIKEAEKAALIDKIRDIKTLCNANGAELTVILIPAREQVSEKALNETLVAYNITPEKLDLSYPNRWMDSVSQQLDIQLIDVTSKFSEADYLPYYNIDEHLNRAGHSLTSEAIKESLSISPEYTLVSEAFRNERYPQIHKTGKISYQRSSGKGQHEIILSDIIFDFKSILRSDYQVLCHPTFNQEGTLVTYTCGDDEKGETFVHVYDYLTGCDRILIPGIFSSIPSFNSDGTLITMPVWNNNEQPHIALCDIAEGKIIKDIPNNGNESWRPIFSKNGEDIFYIENNGHFVIKKYNIQSDKSETFLDTGYDIWDIAISPSGRYICFAGKPTNNWDLYLFDTETKNITQLTDTLSDEWDPSFGETDNDLWFAGESGFFNGIYHKTLDL